MSILQTFYIQWVGDASKAIKEDEKINKSLDKTESKIKSLGDSTSLVGSQFSQLAHSFTAAISAAVGVGAILGGIKGAAEYATQLGYVSQQLGVNTEDLDAWGSAVRNAGGSSEGFQNSLKGLSQHLGGSAQVALKVLPMLADTFQKLGKTRAQIYGKQLGLDESTILLLQHGRREVDALITKQKELGVVSQRDAETFVKFKTEVNDTGHAFRFLFTQLALDSIPGLERFLKGTDKLVTYLGKHKDIIVGSFLAIGGAVAVMNASLVVTSGLIVGVIAAFGILFEDYKKYKAGAPSVFGDIQKKLAVNPELQKENDRYNNLSLAEKTSESLAKIEAALGIANSTPLNSQTSNSILNQSAFNRNQDVNVGPITINTRANDAQGIAKTLGKNVQELWQVNNYFADGVLR